MIDSCGINYLNVQLWIIKNYYIVNSPQEGAVLTNVSTTTNITKDLMDSPHEGGIY